MAVGVSNDALELDGLQDLVDYIEFNPFIRYHILEWIIEKGAVIK